MKRKTTTTQGLLISIIDANLNIEAIENSELVLISKAAHEYSETSIPEFFKFNYFQYLGAYIAQHEVITTAVTERLTILRTLNI
ncbi:hypothetical protein GJU39_18905 [Pedobacter petrophilus]|uniref:Uncharacterized protein n=1 Tax=Pedobacter petrophilus TaxID=1908241 RepID=A0A7K0G2W4_9SPHI|nr:hypothetical protein [Pedobacter petrophilus]MRX78153.1 hypothetical protein [Pedobacter petrophilus]